MLDFDRLNTPPGDGDILIEPPPAEWPRLIAANIRQRADRVFSLAGRHVSAVLEAARADRASQPLVACGHQPAFVHPGVWAKHVAVVRAAEKLGASAFDLVVDNDAPQSADLPVPCLEADGTLGIRSVAVSSAPAGSAYEGRPTLGPQEVSALQSSLEAMLGASFDASMLPRYIRHLDARSDSVDFVDQHLAGRAVIDRELKADLDEARISRAFGGALAAELILNAEPFSVAYNQALSQYRREYGVRSPDRPLPDLQRLEGRTEVALWIYQPRQRRQRLWVNREGDCIALFADTQAIGTLPAGPLARDPDETLTAIRPWVVRPRALTLTLWARLLACDFFVHGIGGAKYDRITDGIIRRYFRCPPPAYACVTATLKLPLPRFGHSTDVLRHARRERRDWRFNPQRYLTGAPAEWLAERARLIAESMHLAASQAPRLARRENYHAIHGANRRLMELDPSGDARRAARIVRIERELLSDRVADSREFFYALQPAERLAGLADRLRENW